MSTYTIGAASEADTGSYDIVVTNACGSATSAAGTIAITPLSIAMAQAMGRRGGDWLDVVLSVVAESMPALDSSKAVVAGLPQPEQKGDAAVLEPLATAPAQARQDFANGAGALLVLVRKFGDPRSDARPPPTPRHGHRIV